MATAQLSYNTKEESLAKKSCEDVNDDNFENHVKPWKQGKYRDFLLTLNCEINENIETSKTELLKKFNNLKKYLLHLKYTYILCSLEKNKRDYYHIHTFIQFDTPHKLCIDKIEGANIRIINKTINKVIDYVKKDGVILDEFGYPRYITGNPSIKDIAMSKMSEINENSNAKYYRVYKEIKKDNQGLFNSPKNIYIMPSLTFDDKFKNYNFLIIEKCKIKQWPINMIVETNYINENNLNTLFNPFNKPIQGKYFPANIENILFIIPDNIEPKYKNMIDMIKQKAKTIKPNKYANTIHCHYDKGELDNEEYEENDE